MSNRRRPSSPWLTNLKPGERMGLVQRILLAGQPKKSRRYQKGLKRKNWSENGTR